MTGLRWQGAAGLLGGGVLVAAALALASVALVPDPPRPMSIPTASELLELEPYLDPDDVRAVPGTAGLPERVVIGSSPFGDGAWRGDGQPRSDPDPGGNVDRGEDRGSAPQRPRWSLSAIMIAGERRIAIINDRMVRPGDRLDDGTRIEVVEGDHVVIITPSGQRRRLELER